MGIFLFLIAAVLISFLFGISVLAQSIYFLTTLKWKTGSKQVNNFFYAMAVSLDRFGNVSCAFILNLVFVRKGGMLHGDSQDVASYVLGRNKYKNKLTAIGRFMVWFLSKIDKKHVEKSIEEKIKNDKQAHERFLKDEYYK
tara:strand:- start:110 stop:532 length:423 start_codon:yes stop_codon:yes gene_type:complete